MAHYHPNRYAVLFAANYTSVCSASRTSHGFLHANTCVHDSKRACLSTDAMQSRPLHAVYTHSYSQHHVHRLYSQSKCMTKQVCHAEEERRKGYKKKSFKTAKLDFVDQMLKWSGAHSPSRVLDVGCGIGGTTRILAKNFPDGQVQGGHHSPVSLIVHAFMLSWHRLVLYIPSDSMHVTDAGSHLFTCTAAIISNPAEPLHNSQASTCC